jgi:hypothetical protein
LLEGGTSREDLIRDLLSKGVPERTAERIVTAVEQEHAVKSSPPHTVPHMKLWLAYMLGPTFMLALSTCFTIGISQDRSLKANNYLIVAMVVSIVVSGIVAQRLVLRARGPRDLPPPPDRP